MIELREFIYIDNDSLNSNLSSLGKGIPSEITHASEDQTEKSGGAGGKVMGVGAEGNYGSLNRNTIETTLNITAPYRFQNLLDELAENKIDIHENPDPRSLSRGDVIRLEGEVFPMSMLKFEIAFEAFNELTDDEMGEALQTLDDVSLIPDTEKQQLEAVGVLLKRFIGTEIPLRLETNDSVYCLALDRDKMRIPASKAFIDNNEFTVVGRAARRVYSNDSWDPIHALNVIDRYVPGHDVGEDLENDLKNLADDLNLPMEPEDLEVRGHTVIIEPIAVYW